MEKVYKVIGVAVVAILMVALVASLLAFPTEWLWNWLMPQLFRFHAINVFQAWGLMALSGLLFRSTHSSDK